MSTNEQKPEVTTEEKGNEVETTEVEEATEETTTQEEKKGKPTETLEAREARLERQLEQTRKKLGKDGTKPKQETSAANDLGELAYLAVNGIKTPDERAFYNKMKAETGKSGDALLESTYFQIEFKDFKEKKASSQATPSASKRSNNSSVDTVEYWIAKGELPPADQVQLRRDVVNARMKKDESKGQFYNS